MPTRAVERNPAVERLAETVTMRRQLCDEHIAVESQASHLEDAVLQRMAKRRLTRIKTDIALLDKRWPSWSQLSQSLPDASACCARCPASAPRSPIPCWPCCPNSARSAASRSPRWSAWRHTTSIAAGSAGGATSTAVVSASATHSTCRPWPRSGSTRLCVPSTVASLGSAKSRRSRSSRSCAKCSPSVDAPLQARENVGVVVARGRMLSSVRPLMRHEDSRRPVWEFADWVQITRSVLEAQWKALVVPAPSRRLLRHTFLPLALTSSRSWSVYAAAAGAL